MSVRITYRDMVQSGTCRRARMWFDANGLDWQLFLRDGMTAEELKAAGTHHAAIDRAAEAAKRRAARGR